MWERERGGGVWEGRGEGVRKRGGALNALRDGLSD